MILLTGGSEEFVYLCFESRKVVLESSGSLFAAAEFLECLESRFSQVREDGLTACSRTLAKSASCRSCSVSPFCLGGMVIVVVVTACRSRPGSAFTCKSSPRTIGDVGP
jgi:radical SAM protein with 4Fe4S-binding SPASM domain